MPDAPDDVRGEILRVLVLFLGNSQGPVGDAPIGGTSLIPIG